MDESQGAPASTPRARPAVSRRRLIVAAAIVAVVGVAAATVAIVVARREPVVATPRIPVPTAQGIAGALFQDRDGDGRRSPGEVALPGWTVRVLSTGPLPLDETVTDDAGVFSFPTIDAVTPGETTVQVRVAPVMEGPAATTMPHPSAVSQSFTVGLGTRATIPVASFRQCLDPDECAGLDLPDLVPQLTTTDGNEYPPPTAVRVDSTTEPGRTLLRFATSTANLGGLLHVTALPADPTEHRQRIQQRVYGSQGVLIHDAGEFVFHPEHHHVHVSGFEAYELLSADQDTVLRSSGKVSFCLTDILAVDPPTRADGDLFLDLPPLDCGVGEQGINAGYADYYGAELPDQWIDVTDLPSGRYRIRIVVDPDHRLLETDHSNNTVTFPVDYVAP